MKKLNFGWVVLGALFLGVAAGCVKKTEPKKRAMGLAIWSNYVYIELLAEFEKQTGIKVQVSNYSSNEELLAKLQAGADVYDVIVPSDYMIQAMIELKLLLPIDAAKTPNRKLLLADVVGKKFDSTNLFSLPYDWGTTGIAYNREKVKTPIRGWKDVWGNAAIAGKYSLLDDSRETIGAALKSLGKSLNTQAPEDLNAARALLLKHKNGVKAYTSEPMAELVSGELWLAHAYMSDALQAKKETSGKIEYVIPEEGATLWIDNLAIPAKAKNVEEAHAFINFLLDAKSNRETVMEIMVSPANREVYALLPEEYQKNPNLFPDKNLMGKLEMMEDLGPGLSLWERTWTEIKAGSAN